MAEILIRLGSSHADPKAWQRLYPVDVKPDGHGWGAMETWPHFAKLRITDVTVEQAQDYLSTDDNVDGVTGETIHMGLRKWKIDLDDVSVPKAIIDKVKVGDVVVVTKAQVVNFIKRVRG